MATAKHVKVRSIRNNTEYELLTAKEYTHTVQREAKYWQSRARETQMARQMGSLRSKVRRGE